MWVRGVGSVDGSVGCADMRVCVREGGVDGGGRKGKGEASGREDARSGCGRSVSRQVNWASDRVWQACKMGY